MLKDSIYIIMPRKREKWIKSSNEKQERSHVWKFPKWAFSAMLKFRHAVLSARKKVSGVYSVFLIFLGLIILWLQYKGSPLDMVKKLVKGYCHKKFSSELISYNAITEIGICQLPLSYLTVMPQTAIFQYVLNFFQKKKIPLLNFFFAFRYIFFSHFTICKCYFPSIPKGQYF